MGFGNLGSGIEALIARKYDIMQQAADTQRLGVTADANLTNIRAGLMPAQSAADIGKVKADTANTIESTKFIGPLARSGIRLQGAQGGLYGAQTGQVQEETTGIRQLNRMSPYGFKMPLGIEDMVRNSLRLGTLGN